VQVVEVEQLQLGQVVEVVQLQLGQVVVGQLLLVRMIPVQEGCLAVMTLIL
jgi:hypothetical protein